MPKRLPRLGLHKPTGQYRVVIAGKHHYLGADLEAAERRYDDLIIAWKLRRPVVKPAGGVSVAHLADQYKADCITRDIGWDGHKKGAMRWIAATRHWHTPANLFDAAAMIEVFTVNTAARRESKKPAYAAWTLASRRKAIIAMFKRGAALGLVDPAVWHRLKSLSPRDLGIGPVKRKPKPASVEDVEKAIAAADPMMADMLTVHRWTGMRPGELCRLSWAEIDTTAPTWLYTPVDHKTAHRGAERVIFIGPRAQAVLMKHRGKGGAVFRTPEGQPWRTDTYGKSLDHLCKRAGVVRFTPNQLRHLRLSEIRRQAGIEAAQVIGGHAHLSTTEVYAERQHELARRVAGETG